MAPSPSPIQILPATEDDCLAIADIESLAFEPDPGSRIMFGPRNVANLPFRAAQLKEVMNTDPTVRFFKAVVDDQIVAAAQWHFRTNPDWHLGKGPGPNPSTMCGIDPPTSWPPGSNAPALDAFFGWIYEVRKRRMGGKAHALLSLLVTRPDFQGRGAASALVKHGLQLCDQQNLPAWLEASTAGYPVYKKLGFEDVEVHETDYRPYGGEWTARLVGMLRPVQKKTENGSDAAAATSSA
ncbi:hypothetical protein VTO42DRAFT_3397 [Malbranchea cinnamomea]